MTPRKTRGYVDLVEIQERLGRRWNRKVKDAIAGLPMEEIDALLLKLLSEKQKMAVCTNNATS